MTNLILTIAIAVFSSLSYAQTMRVNPNSIVGAVGNEFNPGFYYVPKTNEAIADFNGNGIHYNSTRTHGIEIALNYSNNLVECLAILDANQAYLEAIDASTDKFVVNVFSMPAWLSSSSDTTVFNGQHMVLNTKPPANYDQWQAVIDSIVRKMNVDWGLNPYYEFWNEAETGLWTGTQSEFIKLYKYTAAGVKNADPNAYVGGVASNNWSSTLYDFQTFPGYMNNAAADTTLISIFIDSCAIQGLPIDFITWHDFGDYIQHYDRPVSYIRNKLASSGYPASTPLLIDEYNANSATRDTPPHAPLMVSKALAMNDADVDNKSIAAWQDFSADPIEEFYGGYGIISYNGLHKPAWTALQLLNKLNGNKIANDTIIDFEYAVTLNADTLSILIPNLAINPTTAVFDFIFHERYYNASDILSVYAPSTLDSILQGYITPSGGDSLSLALIEAQSLYQEAINLLSNPRNIDLIIEGNTTPLNGAIYWVDATNNNTIYLYDSLINSGYTRQNAIDYILPIQGLVGNNTSITDSLYSVQMPPNSVVLIQFYGILAGIGENQPSSLFDDIILYPNPSTGILMIDAEVVISYEIFDNLGKPVIRRKSNNEIDLSDQALGTYFARIVTEQGTFHKKIIHN